MLSYMTASDFETCNFDKGHQECFTPTVGTKIVGTKPPKINH